jgi:hypothetical protein
LGISYYDNNDNEIKIRKPNEVFPNAGGITGKSFPMSMLVEFLSHSGKYRVHTVQIYNPKVCNVRGMFGRETIKHDDDIKTKEKLDSLLLDETAIIDMDYLIAFKPNTTASVEDINHLRVDFIQTNNGKYPENCEMRLFVEQIN